MQRKTGNPGKKKPGRASLPPLLQAPPRNAPFTGLTGLPARNTQIPNLTEKVAVAKARVTALKDAGLVPEAQREAAVAAQAILDRSKPVITKPARSVNNAPGKSRKPQQRTPQTLAKRSAEKSPALPAWLTQPAVALDQPRATRAPATPTAPSPGRGAPLISPRQGMAEAQAKKQGGNLLGSLKDYASLGLGTALEAAASIPDTVRAPQLRSGSSTGSLGTDTPSTSKVKPTHLLPAISDVNTRLNQTALSAAAQLGRAGTTAVGNVPHNFEVVAPAGAASFKPVTKDELKALEAKGYDLAPKLRARFLKNAAKNGWNPAELDGISGSALIDKAFTKPGNMGLRVLGNFAGGVAKLGTLPAGIEGIVRETGEGRGLQAAQALGEGLISELPVIGKHKTQDTIVADPFGFISQFAGAGKTVGSVSALAKAGLKAGAKTAAKERIVESAASGLKVNRGPVAPNAWDATGQAIADKAAASIPRIGQRLEAEVVDKSVRRLTNKHAPEYVAVQRPYKQALDKVGRKRAAELSGYQMAGGKPERLAAFYRSQGNQDAAKFFDKVAAGTKTLSDKDRAFMDAHAPVAEKTTQAWMTAGKFGPTAAKFRRYSPLIRSEAHLGDPNAQRILALRDEYLKGFNVMPEQDVAALRGAIDQSVDDFAKQHLATPESLIAKAKAEHASERARIEASAPASPAVAKGAPVPRSVSTLVTKLEKEFPGVKLALSEKGGHITLSRIELPKEARGQGTGSQIMERIHAYADAKGKTVALTPSGDFGGSVPRLKKFYKRHGYVPNTGRSKDFETTEAMLRTPGEAAVTPPAAVARVDLSQAHAANDARLAERIKQAESKTPGIEPVYVEYSQPKPLVAPPFKPGPGGPTGFKTPRGRQKVETGATFESGKFLIDPNAPLVESVRAQRAHLADVLHEDVSKAVGQHLAAGDPIPTGHVFVSETNLRGLRRTTNDLVDNPVSSPAYDEFAAQKQGIFDRLTGAAVPSGERVPRGEKGYAIPEGSWKRILDHTRPPSRSAWDKTMKKYQQILVSYRPSTIVNNTVGSIPLAMTGGAGPKSFARAARAMRDPSLAPAILRGHGVAGSMAPSVRSKVGAGMDFMRAQSARGEDFSRLATYFAKAGPTLKKRAKELEMSADDYQRALAKGDIDPQRLDSFLDHAEKFVGDVARPDGKLGRFASHSILFHRWIGHMAKLMLYTLPVKHPRRLDVLLTLSNYGDQYRQEHGVWPDWYREYLPLFQSVKRIGASGKPQVFTKTFSTQGVNPFSTLNNFANPVSLNDVSGQSSTEAIKDLLLGVAAPPISVVGKTLFDRPYDSTDAGRFLLGQTMRQIPGLTVVKPQGGMSPDSIPFFSERRKEYSSGRKGQPLPWDFRPVARAEPGVLGALLRYGLGGVYDVPAQGPIHSIDTKKHIGAKAAAARRKG